MDSTFRDAFNLVANDNNELSHVKKFVYLRIYLTEYVLRLQAQLTLRGNNYKMELRLLEKRFGSTQVIINSPMEALCKLPLIRNSENIKNMRKFYDKM